LLEWVQGVFNRQVGPCLESNDKELYELIKLIAMLVTYKIGKLIPILLSPVPGIQPAETVITFR